MIGKQNYTNQAVLFTGLSEQLNQQHPLYLLANKINWQVLDAQFSKHFSTKMETPSKPILWMVSLLILKHLCNLSDDNLVEQNIENVYYQYFGGEQFYHVTVPSSLTELKDID